MSEQRGTVGGPVLTEWFGRTNLHKLDVYEKLGGYEGLRKVVSDISEACRNSGFFYVAVCDHVAIPRELAPAMSTTWYEPISTLGFLAAQTTRTHLMTNVFVGSYRHPLQTAKAFATLDTLSGGRVILGMGAGHVEKEFDALGLPFATFSP